MDLNFDFVKPHLGSYSQVTDYFLISHALNAEVELYESMGGYMCVHVSKISADKWERRLIVTSDEDVIALLNDPWGKDWFDAIELGLC